MLLLLPMCTVENELHCGRNRSKHVQLPSSLHLPGLLLSELQHPVFQRVELVEHSCRWLCSDRSNVLRELRLVDAMQLITHHVELMARMKNGMKTLRYDDRGRSGAGNGLCHSVCGGSSCGRNAGIGHVNERRLFEHTAVIGELRVVLLRFSLLSTRIAMRVRLALAATDAN